MATPRRQRVGIWIIAIALTIGTIGGFLAMILQPENEANDQARYEELSQDYQTELNAFNTKVAQALSDKYYQEFSIYQDQVGSFDADSVAKLGKKDLKDGSGEQLTEDSSFQAYYIGWNPSGTVFDSSLNGESLGAPISVSPGSVIKGWTQGVAGMKEGGVRELTIPADLAYGQDGRGEDIPPDAPLKFIIMVLPTYDEEELVGQPAPQPSEDLMNLYMRMQG